MHGGKSPGAPRGKLNGNYKNGNWTKEAISSRREVAEILREAREILEEMDEVNDRCLQNISNKY